MAKNGDRSTTDELRPLLSSPSTVDTAGQRLADRYVAKFWAMFWKNFFNTGMGYVLPLLNAISGTAKSAGGGLGQLVWQALAASLTQLTPMAANTQAINASPEGMGFSEHHRQDPEYRLNTCFYGAVLVQILVGGVTVSAMRKVTDLASSDLSPEAKLQALSYYTPLALSGAYCNFISKSQNAWLKLANKSMFLKIGLLQAFLYGAGTLGIRFLLNPETQAPYGDCAGISNGAAVLSTTVYLGVTAKLDTSLLELNKMNLPINARQYVRWYFDPEYLKDVVRYARWHIKHGTPLVVRSLLDLGMLAAFTFFAGRYGNDRDVAEANGVQTSVAIMVRFCGYPIMSLLRAAIREQTNNHVVLKQAWQAVRNRLLLVGVSATFLSVPVTLAFTPQTYKDGVTEVLVKPQVTVVPVTMMALELSKNFASGICSGFGDDNRAVLANTLGLGSFILGCLALFEWGDADANVLSLGLIMLVCSALSSGMMVCRARSISPEPVDTSETP